MICISIFFLDNQINSCCYFEISHVNSTKHSFFCGIEASHEGDSAHAEVVACFERVSVDTKNTLVLHY